MPLSKMRFKTFEWPHNPRVYSIQFERSMAVNQIPFGGYVLQELGQTRRVMRGEGEFVGEDAYTTFQKLASLFYERSAGTLVHPLWDTTTAWLVSLRLEQEPRADYVAYSFEFWEDRSGGSGALKQIAAAEQESGAENSTAAVASSSSEVWHTVVKGECLWRIANDYGVSLTGVIALNPQIKNPNLIYVGQRVRVK